MRGQEGKLNIVSLGLMLALAGAIYSAMFYLPPWMKNRRIQRAMREAVSTAWRGTPDEALVNVILRDTRESVKLPDGTPIVDAGMIAITRDGETISVDINYAIERPWPFTSRVKVLEYYNHVEASLLPPAQEKQDTNFLSEFFN